MREFWPRRSLYYTIVGVRDVIYESFWVIVDTFKVLSWARACVVIFIICVTEARKKKRHMASAGPKKLAVCLGSEAAKDVGKPNLPVCFENVDSKEAFEPIH